MEEALQTLATQAAAAVPLRSRGEAALAYHVPDKRVPERHDLLLQVRFSPPRDIYIQGDVSVAQRLVVMGSNRQQFWLALSPKEVSSYYIGDWDEVRDFEGLLLSPQVVFDAFGIFAEPNSVPDAAPWSLENKGPYDVLTRRDEAGRPVKRVYIYACEYRIHRIEYFDSDGAVVAVAQFGEYDSVTEDFSVPTRIRVVSTAPDGRKDTTDIRLIRVETASFNDHQRERLFSPPKTGKYEHIYRYEAGRWVPQ